LLLYFFSNFLLSLTLILFFRFQESGAIVHCKKGSGAHSNANSQWRRNFFRKTRYPRSPARFSPMSLRVDRGVYENKDEHHHLQIYPSRYILPPQLEHGWILACKWRGRGGRGGRGATRPIPGQATDGPYKF